MKKASLDLLIARKTQSQAGKMVTKEIDVPALGLTFTVVKMPLHKVLGILDAYTGSNSLSNNLEMCKELIYNSIPLLQDPKLQDAYECAEPYDIVAKVMDENIKAIGDLGAAISEMYGLGDQAVNDLKN